MMFKKVFEEGKHFVRRHFGKKEEHVTVVIKDEVTETLQDAVDEEVDAYVKAQEEKTRLDNFYGCDEKGRLCGGMVFMAMNEIGLQVLEESKKKYILRDIDNLHEKISIMHFISAWRGTGKSEWECMMGFTVVYPVRKAWSEGKTEADITRLFEMTLLANPTGREDEEIMEFNGTPYRVLTQEKIREKVMKFFTIQEETDEAIYLTLNVG